MIDYPCVLCDRYFGSKEALEEHQQASPVHKKSFYCQTCDCFLGSSKALKKTQMAFSALPRMFRLSSGRFLGWRRDEVALSYTLARCSILDTPALPLQRHVRTLVSANPITTTTLSKTAKKNVPKPTQETREYFMFPALHANITKAVFPEITSTWFNENNDDDNYNHEWLTHVMGRFICNNNVCKKQLWVSRKVPIEIRGYEGNGYSAVVYNQRCKSCKELGTFVLDDESYIDRVAYRLKKWAGVRVVPPYYGRTKGPPHEREFCEGCKRGKCQEGMKEDNDLVFY
jgi:hypothetical protein